MVSFPLYVFKYNIWKIPGLHILLIFTVSHGFSLVEFGVFCCFPVQIDYEHAGSYWPSCFVSHIPKFLINLTKLLQLLDFVGLEFIYHCLGLQLVHYV